jgi:osmoprotectant transport system permease protein
MVCRSRPRTRSRLAYEALAAGRIDVMDVYTTDAKITRYNLRVLSDDRHFFPSYAALLLHRLDLPQRLPKTWTALTALEGTISVERNASHECAGGARWQVVAAVAQVLPAAVEYGTST